MKKDAREAGFNVRLMDGIREILEVNRDGVWRNWSISKKINYAVLVIWANERPDEAINKVNDYGRNHPDE